MRQHILRLTSTAGRSVLRQSLGSLNSFAIGLLALPLLSRIYDPGYFGSFGLLISLTGPLTTVVTLKYELAIVGEDTTESAEALRRLARYTSFILSGIISLLIFSMLVAEWTPFSLRKMDLGLLPIGLVLSALLAIETQSKIRQAKFHLIAKARETGTVCGVVTQIAAGLLSPTSTMLYLGYLIGIAGSIVILGGFTRDRPRTKHHSAKLSLMKTAKTKREYPIKVMPAQVTGALSSSISTIAITSLGGVNLTAYFSMANRAFGLPAQVTGLAVNNVFFHRASEKLRSYGGFRILLARTLVPMAAAGVCTAIMGAILSPYLVPVFLGSTWTESIPIFQIIAIVAGTSLATSPIDKWALVLGYFSYSVVWQIIRLVMYCAVWFACSKTSANDIEIIMAFGAVSILLYLFDVGLALVVVPRERQLLDSSGS